MYEDVNYAATRLNNTIVMYKRTPILISRVYGDFMAVVFKLLDKNSIPLRVELSELNVANFKLGFVNDNIECSFLARKPKRRDYRQGLNTNNVDSSNAQVTEKLIAKALLHRYPTFTQATFAVLVRGVESRAWCEDFALHGKNIIWRYHKVGNLDNGVITLLQEHKFLKISLERSIGYGKRKQCIQTIR